MNRSILESEAPLRVQIDLLLPVGTEGRGRRDCTTVSCGSYCYTYNNPLIDVGIILDVALPILSVELETGKILMIF